MKSKLMVALMEQFEGFVSKLNGYLPLYSLFKVDKPGR
jgi:hypothetical protein